jgi:hypothetical protein
MRKAFLIISVMLFCGLAAKAQSAQPTGPGRNDHRFAVSIHPLQFIIRGQRVDFEMRIKDTRHWILAGPQYYSGNIAYRRNTFDDGETHKLNGYGIELGHKIIMDSSATLYTYVMYGAAFHHFTIGFNSPSWVEVVEDGITYYKYADVDQKEKITRFSGLITAGMHVPLTDFFNLDLYTGIGMRNASVKATTTPYPDYDGFLNYAFTGVYPIAGAKLGVRF